MWAWALAAESALLNWCSMFSRSLRSFSGALALRGNKIWHSVLDDLLAGPGYSAVIDLSSSLALFEVGTTATGVVFPFRSTMVDCYARSVLTLDTTTVTMLGRAGGYKYVGGAVGVETKHSILYASGHCGVWFPAARCLAVCLSEVAAVTDWSKISGGGFAVIGRVHVGMLFTATVHLISLVRTATGV